MENVIIRLTKITLRNFKNVSFGELSLTAKNNVDASILGIYGQNGSGKTAIIESLGILRSVLCGTRLNRKYADYINIDADESDFLFEFFIHNKETKETYKGILSFKLRKELIDNLQNTDKYDHAEIYIPVIFDEKLLFSYEGKQFKFISTPIMDAGNDYNVLGPKTKYLQLLGENVDETELRVIKKMSEVQSRSFIFSRELLNIIRKNCQDVILLNGIESLVHYGNYCLFIIDTKNTGLISLDAALPLSFKIRRGHGFSLGNIALSMEKETPIRQDLFDVAEKIIENMNIVLQQLIPGFTVKIVNLGPVVLKDGTPGYVVELFSVKNGKSIPIRNESEGIKKIVSILQLLIVMYNNSSITVAIDELDAGIFEYLLGEILRIISESGKGQLIFTSHNLRPLETIDKKFIAFTTTNPNNRYIRLTNVKANNNVRSFYYRDIILGEQKEVLYDPTNNFEIAFAFKEADENGS